MIYLNKYDKEVKKVGFLERERMQEMLDELAGGDIEESRRVEIINELGQQHSAGLQEYEELQNNFGKATEQLNESRSAMAKMYNQLNAQNLGSNDVAGTEEDPDLQETITLDDLLAKNKNKKRNENKWQK